MEILTRNECCTLRGLEKFATKISKTKCYFIVTFKIYEMCYVICNPGIIGWHAEWFPNCELLIILILQSENVENTSAYSIWS